MPIVLFETLQLGGASFSKLSAPSRDYNTGKDVRIDGILGFGAFQNALVTLDFVNGKLRLENGSLPETDGREIFAFTTPRRIAQIPIAAGGKTVEVIIDTGAQIALMLPAAMATSRSRPPAAKTRWAAG